MEEKEMIQIQNPDGTSLDVEIITYLFSDDNQKTYLVYSKGETTGVESDEVIYISKINKEDNKYKLENITDDTEWSDVQKLLKKIANA